MGGWRGGGGDGEGEGWGLHEEDGGHYEGCEGSGDCLNGISVGLF
jgi:hypothetical protein